MINGKLVDTPRLQQPYYRDYSFTGVYHPAAASSTRGGGGEGAAPTPPIVDALTRWANAHVNEWVEEAERSLGIQRRAAVPRLPSQSSVEDRHGSPSSPCVTPSTEGGDPTPWLLNSALVNWYRNGHDYIGAHSDRQANGLLLVGSPIVSVSYGAERTFRIRPMRSQAEYDVGHRVAVVRDIPLRHGTVVVMGGMMQEFFTHEVPKVGGDKGGRVGARVNVTMRCFR